MPPSTFRRARIAALAAVVLAATSLAGCGGSGNDGPVGSSGSSTAGSERPYRVLLLGAISDAGVLGDNATTAVQAARASANLVNDEGGILGHRVEIAVADDHGDPTAAATLVQEAIGSDRKPDAILNSGPSTVAAATLPVISKANILSFNIGPTDTSADPDDFPLNFDLSASAGDQLVRTISYLKEKGYQKVAILHGNSPYAKTYGAISQRAATDAGLHVVGNEQYDSAATDTTSQLTTLKAQAPDVLMLDAYGPAVGYVLRGVRKIGWTVPIVGDSSVAATRLISAAPPTGLLGTEDVKNLVLQVYSSSVFDPDDALVTTAVKAMLTMGPIRGTLGLAHDYDAIRLIRAAAESAKSVDDPNQLAKALENSSVTENAKTAIRKHYIFSADSHAPKTQPTDYTLVAPSPVVDGQYRPTG